MEDESADFDLSKLNSNLWVVDVGTQEWRQLTELKGQGAWSPVWTPDDSAVAFMANIGNQLNGWLVNVDERSLQQLTFDGRIMPRALSVIP
jgi:TolB protein